MPHIVAEYSDNLATLLREGNVLRALHTVVLESGLFAPEAVKARSMAYKDVILYQGADRFMHITVSILSGRTQEQRAALSKAVFDCALAKLPSNVKLSVNIHEMNADTYAK